MKNAMLMVIIFFIAYPINAQYGNFRKYQVAETGHYCYMPADPESFDKQKSEDGLTLYIAAVDVDNCSFGSITVILGESFYLESKENLRKLLVSYMDYLKESFEITGSMGYGFGHTLDSSPAAQGVLDYWEDKNGNQMVVKGWVTNKAIAFMYVKGKELPVINVTDLFLNGFIFKP